MQGEHPNDSAILADNGLNLQAVFELQELPASIRRTIEEMEPGAAYRQLLLFGHGGRRMWQALSESSGMSCEHPVDVFSADVVARYFAEENPGNRYLLLYPQHQGTLPLQQLGRLAGWHHDSPFKVGVNTHWGPWFAYRAAVLADTAFAPTVPMSEPSPCERCTDRSCLSACPAVSASGDIPLAACIDARMERGSPCARSCLARLACPVKCEHRYGHEQMSYHYGRSLQTLIGYRKGS